VQFCMITAHHCVIMQNRTTHTLGTQFCMITGQ